MPAASFEESVNFWSTESERIMIQRFLNFLCFFLFRLYNCFDGKTLYANYNPISTHCYLRRLISIHMMHRCIVCFSLNHQWQKQLIWRDMSRWPCLERPGTLSGPKSLETVMRLQWKAALLICFKCKERQNKCQVTKLEKCTYWRYKVIYVTRKVLGPSRDAPQDWTHFDEGRLQ